MQNFLRLGFVHPVPLKKVVHERAKGKLLCATIIHQTVKKKPYAP